MENKVEEVEYYSQSKGSPANCKCYDDFSCGEDVSSSVSINHRDALNRGIQESNQCQAELEIV